MQSGSKKIASLRASFGAFSNLIGQLLHDRNFTKFVNFRNEGRQDLLDLWIALYMQGLRTKQRTSFDIAV